MIKYILLSFFICSVGFADPITLYRLPKGKRVQAQGETYQGYTLEEMKQLLLIDSDLRALEEEVPKLKDIERDKQKIIESKDKIILSKDIQIDLLSKDRDRITDKWKADNKLKHECEQKPKFGSWIAWGTAGILAAVALGFGIAYGTK
jgi:hypothetical protein